MNKFIYVGIFALLFMMSSCSKDVKELKELSPGLAWGKYLEGDYGDSRHHQAITSTSDNGFMIAYKDSLVKYNEMGERLSAKGFAYTPIGVQKTMNGFVVFGKNLTGGWLAQLDENLDIQWEISTATRGFNSVIEANDGYVITGTLDGNATIAKFSFSGNLEWEKSFERDGSNHLTAIQTTTDGFIAIGHSSTTALGEQFGLSDIWVVKLSSTGTVQWEHLYGDASDDYAWAIHQTNDGFLMLSEGNLMHLDQNGTLISKHNLNGGTYRTMLKTDDDHFILGGETSITYGVYPYPYSQSIVTIVKVNQNGERIWQLQTGSASDDDNSIFAISKTTDNGYVAFGFDNYNYEYSLYKVKPE